jgi:hypothetical protein
MNVDNRTGAGTKVYTVGYLTKISIFDVIKLPLFGLIFK